MKKTKEKRGITLIALVITIVILLILAGITIQALTGSGLFGKAKDSKTKSEIAQEIEQLKLAVYAVRTDYLNNEGKVYYSAIAAEIQNSYGKYISKIEPIYSDNTNEINNIKSYDVVSKINSKLNLSNLFMPTVFAAEENDAVYAKVTYNTKRYYYIRVDSKSEGIPTDIPGEIGDIIPVIPPDSNPSEDPKEPDVAETDASYFTWNYTSYTDAKNNPINGWEITGLSTEGQEAALNGNLKNIVIPKKYTGEYNSVQTEGDVIGLGFKALYPYSTWDDENNSYIIDDCWSYIETIKDSSTVKYIGEDSLICVGVLGIQVSFEEGLEKVGLCAFGGSGNDFTYQTKYISLPDSVKEINCISHIYSKSFFSVGQNLQSGEFSYCQDICQNILFFRGTITDLNNNKCLTENYQEYLSKESPYGGYVYCLGDNKRATQIEDGPIYTWEEIDNLLVYLQNKGEDLQDDAETLKTTLVNNETEALKHF